MKKWDSRSLIKSAEELQPVAESKKQSKTKQKWLPESNVRYLLKADLHRRIPLTQRVCDYGLKLCVLMTNGGWMPITEECLRAVVGQNSHNQVPDAVRLITHGTKS